GRTRDLTTLARLHLHIVDDSANRHSRKRHSITWLNVDGCTCHNLITSSKTLRSENVAKLTIFVTDQCDKRSPVWIVFQTFYRCDYIVFTTFEVNQTIVTFVTTTLITDGNTTSIVTATLLGQTFGQ